MIDDPIAQGYKQLRRIAEQYVDALNRRDMTEPGTDRYLALMKSVAMLEEQLERGEENLASILGVPCKHLWHPMVPRVDRRKKAGPAQLTLLTEE